MSLRDDFVLVVQILAEYGQVTLSGDPFDPSTVIEFNPEAPDVPDNKMLKEFVKRHPAFAALREKPKH